MSPPDALRNRLFSIRVYPLLAAGLVGSALVAYPSMFSRFAPYDDEGFMLISIKSFIASGHLYDQVYGQYGPFFYELWGGLFALLGVDPTHNSGGMATLVLWLAASALIGFSTYRVTGSALLGVCVQLLVFSRLSSIDNEPMHPGGLICLVLSVMTAASTFVARRAGVAMATIGAATGALLLTKLNVGGFALLAVALAGLATYRLPEWRRWLRPLIELFCIALPWLLMFRQLDHGSVRAYAAHATLAIAAVVVALRMWGPSRLRSAVELRWLAWGFGGTVALVVFVALVTGSGPVDLIRGVVIDPFQLPDIFTNLLQLPVRFLALDVAALLACLGAAWLSTHEGFDRPGMVLGRALLGLGAGLAIGLTAAGVELPYAGTGFSADGLWPLGLAWISLLPTRSGTRPETEFSRRLIPALAVLQSLHAYPVAGSQIAFSSFLLLPLAAISFDNGARDITGVLTERFDRRLALAVPIVLVVATYLIVNETIRTPLDFIRPAYDHNEPLQLPGASRLRLPPGDADTYRAIADEIDRRCASFVSLPGLNSFYIWADQPPPTDLNVGDWMFLLDANAQQRVVEAVSGIKRLCLLRNQDLETGWTANRVVPQRPLLRFVSSGFRPLRTIGSYELLIRRTPSQPSASVSQH